MRDTGQTVPGAGDPYTGDCRHPARERSPGGYHGWTHPRYPLRYGSAEVELCRVCGAWQLSRHSPGRWYAGPYSVALRESAQEAE